MELKPNISLLNALVRITCGLAMLAYATAKMVKRPWRESYYWLGLLSAMKVAEGIVRFCPLTYVYQMAKEKCDVRLAEEDTRHEPA